MKFFLKKVSIVLFAAAAFVILACTLPSSVEITGSPNVKFSANMDLSSVFSDSITGAFNNDSDGFLMLPCANTRHLTFVIYLPLFEETLEGALDDALSGLLPEGSVYIISGDKEMAGGSSSSVNLGGMDDYLAGFSFNNVKSHLYISGSDIAEFLSITLDIGGTSHTIKRSNGFIFGESGFSEEEWASFSDDEWDALAAPQNSGIRIDLTELLRDSGNLIFDYDVILEDGSEIPADLLIQSSNIKAELVIWLPLEFAASGDDGGVFALPNDFLGGSGDLFFRTGPVNNGDAITEIIKKLKIKIEMNESPFNGAALIINSTGGFEITNVLRGNSIEFEIDEENMARLNEREYFPFSPVMNIHFAKDQIMAIPRNFRITYLCFEASFDYTHHFRQKEQ
ncbi:MAG: hypothetical protein LBH16_04065 [Treponema sp.]|jgi:hypothetical protein|nr:hypothetical protein [Treponema sp.]